MNIFNLSLTSTYQVGKMYDKYDKENIGKVEVLK